MDNLAVLAISLNSLIIELIICEYGGTYAIALARSFG